jgi:hypothetical protein
VLRKLSPFQTKGYYNWQGEHAQNVDSRLGENEKEKSWLRKIVGVMSKVKTIERIIADILGHDEGHQGRTEPRTLSGGEQVQRKTHTI